MSQFKKLGTKNLEKKSLQKDNKCFLTCETYVVVLGPSKPEETGEVRNVPEDNR